MPVEPAERAVATPVLLIVATDGRDEVQETWSDTFWVDPSENAPRAMNCWMVPTCMVGATNMEDREAEVTVRVVVGKEEILPKVAVIAVVPAATAVARPVLRPTVATDGLDEIQVTSVLISWVVLSEYVPVAVNCWATPTGMLGLVGVTAMVDRITEDTVRVTCPETLPEVAMMATGPPAATPVARPVLRPTVATDGLDELHVTCVVISWLVPSEYVPMATNCCPTPAGRGFGLAGVTVMEDRATEFTVRGVLPEILPEVAVIVTVPAARAVARPLPVTVTTDVLDEAQLTCVVWFVPSEYPPKAVNC